MDNQHPTPAELARFPLFAGLTSDERAALAGHFSIESFDVDRRLVVEGRSGYTFYLVAQGRASVQHDGLSVAEMGPGDFFGEMAILGDGRRTATVTATEPVVAWRMFGTDFRSLQETRPDVAEQLEQAMSARLAADMQNHLDAS